MEDVIFCKANIRKYSSKPNGTSGSGHDGVSPQCLKYGENLLNKALEDIYCQIEEGYSPDQTCQA